MEFGRHLRELTAIRFGALACVALATVAALLVAYRVQSVVPPRLQPRSLQIASASADVLIDTPTSVVLDLRQQTNDIDALTNRAVLLGNVMASAPVLDYIGRRAGIPGSEIRATTPRTPNAPRPFQTAVTKRRARDLLASTDQYRLDVEVNPTVPVMKVYAQAPTARSAEALADGAVAGLRDYLARVAVTERIKPASQVRVHELGRAHGVVINGGVRLEAAALTFVFALAAAAAGMIFLARVRRGFGLAAEEPVARAEPAA